MDKEHKKIVFMFWLIIILGTIGLSVLVYESFIK